MIRICIKKRLEARMSTMSIDVDFEMNENQFAALYGASGAGKTTILRLVSGLLKPDSGIIEVGNEVWYDSKKRINLHVQNRNVGLVFQDYSLFPNMTVKENILYAAGKKQNKDEINKWMEVMELIPLEHHKPDILSGGQKQRVALARALLRRPKLLLLDEPLSALDIEMRMKLQEYILKIHHQFNLTTILVSHDISEIYRMSEKIFFLENGIIKTKGTPEEVFTAYRFNQIYP